MQPTVQTDSYIQSMSTANGRVVRDQSGKITNGTSMPLKMPKPRPEDVENLRKADRLALEAAHAAMAERERATPTSGRTNDSANSRGSTGATTGKKNWVRHPRTQMLRVLTQIFVAAQNGSRWQVGRPRSLSILGW